MQVRLALAALFLVGGCWKLDPTVLPPGEVPFAPVVGAPDGWVVAAVEAPLKCPDGDSASVYVVYPAVGAGPVAAAVLFHSGAFDYVRMPDATDPLAGTHFQDPSRLSASWSVRQVFAMLGMYPSDDASEDHRGALAAALVEQGVAMVVPGNCWGDYWHNEPGTTDNNAIDGFPRQGRVLAEWAWRIASEPSFVTDSGAVMPSVSFDQDQVFMVGLGEGSRAVGELVELGYRPRSLLVDSPVDDLRVYWADQELYEDIVIGLERAFPGGAPATVEGSLRATTWYPERSVFLHSTLDSQIPQAGNVGILERLGGLPLAWVYDAGAQTHVISAGDLPIARQAVAWMLDTDVYDPGDAGTDTGQ